ncbi:universal stress protein [Halomicroarcula limicola]|uniref:Universal stress protein n=1 Tax=Haloarcula limicola TaxID=1429915 RepID=A0A8J8C217_9EURY|nr:universal stress protein [Halomicroarcula limicola]MBV0923051.1 universal stress protein [Halomicroarcula limicola]
MEHILLATDGSEYARAAAKHAIDRAKETGATLHVLCVVDERRFNEPALSSAELSTIYAEDHANMCVAEVSEMAAGSGVRVEGDSRHGLPHEVIVEYAADVGAETIVVGEHGSHDTHFSGVGRKVRELADCKVVVVGAPARA